MSSPGAFKLSRYVVESPVFPDPETGEPIVVVFSTRSASTVTLKEKAWSALISARSNELEAFDGLELVEKKILVPEDENELDVVIRENNSARESYDTLFYVFQPTAACQLACDYCGQSHSNKKLAGENQRHSLDRIRSKLERGKYRALEIGWFGGEPLLGLSTMRSLSPQLQQLAAEHGADYFARLVTNGVLLKPKIAEELCQQHKVTYLEVTIDGPPREHDRRRQFKGKGKPSCEIILDNLKAVMESDAFTARVSIRCNVDRRNVESISELIRMLADCGLHRKIHEFYVAPVHSWGNDVEGIALDPIEFAARQLVWFGEMASLGYRIRPLPIRTKVLCMALKPESELVDAFGSVFNCTEVSYVPGYNVDDGLESRHPTLLSAMKDVELDKQGNIFRTATADGAESYPRTASFLPDFYKRVAAGSYDCDKCPMLPTCGGACPKVWAEGIRPCPPPKYNIGHLLQLDYLLNRFQIVAAGVRATGPQASSQHPVIS